MSLTLELATADDAPQIVALHNATSKLQTEKFGTGHWTYTATEKGVLFNMRRANTYVARQEGQIIATLSLSTTKPWAIDRTYFKPSKRPLYLSSMAVIPEEQGKGIGKLCILQARKVAQKWPSEAIRLDAYDNEAGAGPFYEKCGFTEVGRKSYRGVPLIYLEMLLTSDRT